MPAGADAQADPLVQTLQEPHDAAQVLSWIDICAGLAAKTVARGPVVTASVDSVHFLRPCRLGSVAIIAGMVNRVFQSSMEARAPFQSVWGVGCILGFEEPPGYHCWHGRRLCPSPPWRRAHQGLPFHQSALLIMCLALRSAYTSGSTCQAWHACCMGSARSCRYV